VPLQTGRVRGCCPPRPSKGGGRSAPARSRGCPAGWRRAPAPPLGPGRRRTRACRRARARAWRRCARALSATPRCPRAAPGARPAAAAATRGALRWTVGWSSAAGHAAAPDRSRLRPAPAPARPAAATTAHACLRASQSWSVATPCTSQQLQSKPDSEECRLSMSVLAQHLLCSVAWQCRAAVRFHRLAQATLLVFRRTQRGSVNTFGCCGLRAFALLLAGRCHRRGASGARAKGHSR